MMIMQHCLLLLSAGHIFFTRHWILRVLKSQNEEMNELIFIKQ